MAKIDDILKDLEHNTITFTIPMISNPKKNITFRPLKTKDQKIFCVEKEELDNSEIKNFDAIIKLLDAVIIKCPVPIGKLEMTDFIWLMLNIRAKSIGEIIELVTKCKNKDCGEKNDLNINIYEDYKTDKTVIDNIINVSKNTILTLGNVTIEDFRDIMEYVPEDRDVASIASVVKSVEFEKEIIDVDLEGKMVIVSELTKDVLDKMTKYIESKNKEIKLEKSCKCKKCGTDNTYSFDTFEIIRFF